jgi:hypothetical protein
MTAEQEGNLLLRFFYPLGSDLKVPGLGVR